MVGIQWSRLTVTLSILLIEPAIYCFLCQGVVPNLTDSECTNQSPATRIQPLSLGSRQKRSPGSTRSVFLAAREYFTWPGCLPSAAVCAASCSSSSCAGWRCWRWSVSRCSSACWPPSGHAHPAAASSPSARYMKAISGVS
jgi:hypothetical protein